MNEPAAAQQRRPARKPAPAAQEPSLIVPLGLTVLAVVLMFGFQTFTLMQERQALEANLDAQVKPYAEAERLRGQFEAVASGAAKLADEGNPNASAIVAALERAGVTITRDDSATN